MASSNVVRRTDELQYDFRFWCSKVASIDADALEQVSDKLGMQLKDDRHDSRRQVADEMLKQLTAIKEDVFSRPQVALGNDVRMEDQPFPVTYNDKRQRARKIIFHILRQMSSISEIYLWPPIYAKYKNRWQRTKFTETSKTGKTKIKNNLPKWILNSGHEIVGFLREEPEEFKWRGHLLATNALYVIAVAMPKLKLPEVCGSPSEGECGEEPREDQRSSSEEPCDEDEEAHDTESEYSDQNDEEDEDGEENETKKIRLDKDDEENLQDDESCNREDESEDETEEEEGSSVHYYVGQTLRDVVRRCGDHCKNAKFLLEEGKKDTYSKFQDYDSVAKEKKVMLVDTYLAAAKAAATAHPQATYRCAVIVVRHFVDRKAELIQRFGLTDMKQGLNGGKLTQTKMTDYDFHPATDYQDDTGRAVDSRTEDTETNETVMPMDH